MTTILWPQWSRFLPYRPVLSGLLLIVSFGSAELQQTRADTKSDAEKHDVVVYGGTSSGVIAAVQAKRMGKSVILVCPDKHLGGLSSGGLGWTDTGNKAVIGQSPFGKSRVMEKQRCVRR